MNIPIPFLTTSIETDLMLVLLLTPLWWVTGFSIFAYHLAVLWIVIKFLLLTIRQHRSILFPAAGNWFFLFLISYLISIAINAPLRPSQRIFASLNNWAVLMMGYLVFLLVCNCEAEAFFRRFLKTCRLLCIVTGVIGVGILILWLRGYKQIQIPTLLGRAMPSLMTYPYFFGLLNITGTMPDWLSGNDPLPRLTPYSLAPTSTGGLMLMILPLTYAYYAGERKKFFERILVLLLGLTILVFSFSRSAIYGFVSAIILAFAIERSLSVLLGLSCLFGGLVASGFFARFMEWVFNLRKSSTVGRFQIYQEAVKILFEENPFMGLGVKLRESFTFMAVGTHGGFYLEIMFTAGIIGLLFFVMFHFLVLGNWFMQRRAFPDPPRKRLWKYLGISLIAVHTWLLTDTIVAFPLIAYCYFLLCASVFLLKRLEAD
ncbi:MAG: O-antigen ligase family protein [Candidatus Omnitrophica bacterium]|nr:O-antigen ligase family protein [Candidatus Omnitrophota bacterium]